MTASQTSRIPIDALVVLVGPAGAGKSTWAETWCRPDQIVSSDRLRTLVGTGEDDQQAGTDAFQVLADLVTRRHKRGLLTVVESLGFDDTPRSAWIGSARQLGRPTVAVVFATLARDCRVRNKARANPVPSKVLTAQLKRHEVVRSLTESEFDSTIHPVQPVVVPSALATKRPRLPIPNKSAESIQQRSVQADVSPPLSSSSSELRPALSSIT